tara:strand:+ start:1570 stop:3315 length:1746 start_codon:yes stop_codon:yes gene_type:complete
MSKSSSDIQLVRLPSAECFRLATTSIALPLGLAYISGSLKHHGFKVDILDAVGEAPKKRTGYFKGYLIGLSLEEVVEKINPNTSAIGISVIFTHEWPVAVKLVSLIKKKFPNIPIILGGEHISALPEFSLNTSSADYIVMGEGEETILDLMNAIKNKSSVENIDGIGYKRNNEVVINIRRNRRKSIDDIPYPDWGSFDVKSYHKNRFVGGMYSASLTIPILATRGCPYQCTYCSSPNMWSPLWIPRDPIGVVDEIEYNVKKLGARNFPFQDLTAIIKKDWIKAFCEELIKRDLKISWQLPSGTRSEVIDNEIAVLLKKSGMTSMAYAPESGSDETRKMIKKQMRTDRLLDSIDATVKADLNLSVFLVIGFPHDLPEHLEENKKFVEQLAKHGVTDLSIGFYMALPGTELFYSLYDSNKIKFNTKYFTHILDSLSLFPSLNYCPAISPLGLFLWKMKLYLRFYKSKREGLFGSVARGNEGILSTKGGHESKLPTAFKNAYTSMFDTLKSKRKRWISKKEEKNMFKEWDNIYRKIRTEKIEKGLDEISPSDTSGLYKINVMNRLQRDHKTTWKVNGIEVPSVK